MIRNSLKIFMRSFIREKRYSLVNTIGLGIGISAFLLISLYVKSELEYDKFHEKSDRIYRVLYQSINPTNSLTWARSGPGMAADIRTNYPEVEYAVRILAGKNVLDPDPLVSHGEVQFLEPKLFFADSDFFNVFSFKTLDGSSIPFSDPYDVVLTASTAKKYFRNQNPIGETLDIAGRGQYTVKQVIEDIPSNSHFHFDLIANFQSHSTSKDQSWTWTRVYTYLLLKENVSTTALQTRLQASMDRYQQGRSFNGLSYAEWKEAGNASNTSLQPLESIHLNSNNASEFESGGDMAYVRLFLIVAMLVLFLASINFVNLSTAKATKRAKEVGVKKALGARRKQLVSQFILESVLTCVIATLLAVVVTILTFPYLNDMVGNRIADPEISPWWFGLGAVFILFLGTLSGAYPAFYLSRFQPLKVLKAGGGAQGKKSALRNALTIVQFCTSIGLVIATFTIYNQVNYMKNKDKGFTGKLMVLDRSNVLDDKTEAFKTALKQSPLIEQASASSTVPGSWIGSVNLYPLSGTIADRLVVEPIFTDFEFDETYDFEFVQGRGFSKDFASDSLAVIINEAAFKAYGMESIEGEYLQGWQSAPHPIVGVVKDFNQKSAKEKVVPMVIFVNFFPSMQNMTIRMSTSNSKASIDWVQKTWDRFVPSEPLMYSFMDDNFNRLYRSEIETGNLFSALSTLAILIAGLGLFGMVTFTTEQRSKEFAIRKVLGATSRVIFSLLGKEFGKLISVALVLAVPLVYFLMDSWLDNFAHRTTVPAWAIFVASLVVIMVTLVAVTGKTIKTALENPVKGLREE